MEIKSLANCTLNEILACFYKAFSSYELKMPEDREYWAWRFNAARVDFTMSFGAFESDELIGFIIIGIDEVNGFKTAFNTGTGVIENHRGRKIVDQLYDKAIPVWHNNDVKRGSLEVLTTNDIAIRVYERIGFEKYRTLHSFANEIDNVESDVIVEQMDIDIMLNIPTIDQGRYAWDYTNKALKQSPRSIRAYAVINSSNNMFGYFSINEGHRSLCQLELVGSENTADFKSLLSALGQIWKGSLKLINVDHRRIELIQALKELNWENRVSQFEMQMNL